MNMWKNERTQILNVRGGAEIWSTHIHSSKAQLLLLLFKISTQLFTSRKTYLFLLKWFHFHSNLKYTKMTARRSLAVHFVYLLKELDAHSRNGPKEIEFKI